ncbi:MAG: glycosyltransferase family 4 protein [Methanocorpusculum sp.]
MRVNIRVENYSVFKYVGCATVAMMLYDGLQKTPGVEVELNSREHDHDITHCHTLGPGAVWSMLRAKHVKVLTAHSTPSLNANNLAGASLINKIYKPMYGRYDHIITITGDNEREIKEMLPDMPTTRIPSCVNMEKFKPDAEKRRIFRETYGFSDDDKVILQVAQQTPRKGIYDFLDLAYEHPEYKFMWVGGFPYGPISDNRKKVEARKAKAGDNVIFPGFVPDITGVYAGADVFLFPSYGDLMSISIMEALSSGLPVISRDLSEYRELFPGIAGFFTKNEEIAPLLADEAMLRNAASHARASVEPYDIYKVAQMHADLYAELLA